MNLEPEFPNYDFSGTVPWSNKIIINLRMFKKKHGPLRFSVCMQKGNEDNIAHIDGGHCCTFGRSTKYVFWISAPVTASGKGRFQ